MVKLKYGDIEYRVRWKHFPKTVKIADVGKIRAGTECEVFVSDGDYAVGNTFVNPRDVFDKEMGRTISLGRALASLSLRRDVRDDLLNQYHRRG